MRPVGSLLLDPERHHGAFATDDLRRSEPGEDRDPLALSGLYLLFLGRHVSATAPVDDRHGVGSRPPG
jgi:hypothetical protein